MLASGFHWQCEVCAADGYRFSGIVGTIFENTNKAHAPVVSGRAQDSDQHEGVSALQIDAREWASLQDHLVYVPSHPDHVAGGIHTNKIEGFWSIFKRSIVGSFHKVNAKYLPLYTAASLSIITASMRTFSERD
jgi:hypothetical protein